MKSSDQRLSPLCTTLRGNQVSRSLKGSWHEWDPQGLIFVFNECTAERPFSFFTKDKYARRCHFYTLATITFQAAGSLNACMVIWCVSPLIETEMGPPISQGQQWVSHQLSEPELEDRDWWIDWLPLSPVKIPPVIGLNVKSYTLVPFLDIPHRPSSDSVLPGPPVGSGIGGSLRAFSLTGALDLEY